jgi:hypothetical protein
VKAWPGSLSTRCFSMAISASASACVMLPTKATYQNSARQVIILMRLDLDRLPHRNPDDTEVPCPHLHQYREGYMSLADDIEKLLDDYRAWLKDRTALRELDGSWVEITTPYLDRHNDALQIYARRENGGYLLSDDSYTIHDLEASGCDLQTEKRQDLLKTTLSGFGVKLNQDALEIPATAESFPLRKHNLVQAMLAVNDLFYLARPIIGSLFYEDVLAWLDANDIRYTPRVKFTGTSGFDHLFDSAIPKSRKQPERILRAINRPDRHSAENFMHAWGDTRAVRPNDSRAYAVLNDMEQPISGGVIEAFRRYDIQPVPWSQRIDVVRELAA